MPREDEKQHQCHFLRPRLFAYSALLIVLMGVATYFFASRVPLQLDARRDRNQLSTMTAQGMIENSYVLKVTNKTQKSHEYQVTLEPQDGMSLQSRFKSIPLDPSESYEFPVSVWGDPKVIKQGNTPITLKVVSTDDGGKYSAVKQSVFTTDK